MSRGHSVAKLKFEPSAVDSQVCSLPSVACTFPGTGLSNACDRRGSRAKMRAVGTVSAGSLVPHDPRAGVGVCVSACERVGYVHIRGCECVTVCMIVPGQDCGTEAISALATREALWRRWHLSWAWGSGRRLNRGVSGGLCRLRGQHGCGLCSENRTDSLSWRRGSLGCGRRVEHAGTRARTGRS